MFQRFTEPARQAVVEAQWEARELKHDWIGTEHLLLGLLRADGGLAAEILAGLGIELESVRAKVAQIPGTEGDLPAALLFTPRTKTVLELALRVSVRMGHDWVGTEHLLLGLADHGTGVAVTLLAEAGAPPELVFAAVVAAMDGERA